MDNMRTLTTRRTSALTARALSMRAVKFAAGHDYLGRSDGRGSFLVWTYNLKNITVQPSFCPGGAPPEKTYEYDF
ncbi:hypothetical protein LXA43DRAFT_983856, partial [Ganoderma leucocontextum]